jgi:hypothetical protein
MTELKEDALSWKSGFWSASGVLLSFAVGINVGLRLKAAKARRLAEKPATEDLPLTVHETFTTEEKLSANTQTPVDQHAPLRDLPAITGNACVPAAAVEITQAATIGEVAIESASAPVAQIADGGNLAKALLPVDQVIHEMAKSEEQLGSRLFPTFTAMWHRLRRGLRPRQSRKRLRVCETVSLGEKRFVAVIQVDGEQFLVGGSPSSVSTLAHLNRPQEFAEVFGNRYQQGFGQA